MTELCPLVAPSLRSENTNVLIESIRTLGRLHYTEGVEEIRQHTKHPQWSVRSTAVTALASIAPRILYL